MLLSRPLPLLLVLLLLLLSLAFPPPLRSRMSTAASSTTSGAGAGVDPSFLSAWPSLLSAPLLPISPLGVPLQGTTLAPLLSGAPALVYVVRRSG